MNSRERWLLILVGTAAGLLVVKAVVGKYTDSLKWYDGQVLQLQKDLGKAHFEQTRAQFERTQWLGVGAETLSMDANEATTRLREELGKLGEKGKLKDVEVVLEGMPKRWLRNGVRTLNATVTGQATFDDIVGFLFELHRQPYAARVKSLTLDQVNKPTKRGEKAANPGLLKMTAYLDTLILPSCEMVAQVVPAVLEGAKRKPTSRPAEVSLAGYKPLLDKKLFQPYEMPVGPVGPRTPLPPQRVVTSSQPATPVVQPPQPPRDAMMVLGRVLSSPRGQLAVLEDRARHGEDEYKEVGDEMYGGTLIYVDPTGAVTEKDGQRWFHAIDEPLQNCKPLTEQDQPTVFDELMKLEHQATGISARPQ